MLLQIGTWYWVFSCSIFSYTQTYSNAAASFQVVIFQVVYELLPARKLTSKWIFSNPRMSRCLRSRHFPAAAEKTSGKLPPLTNQSGSPYSHIWLPHVRIWKYVGFCRAIWFHPHHRHLACCCVYLANPMCTGIDVLCQGDWCPLPPQPAAVLASSSSSWPKVFFLSAQPGAL